MNDKQESLEAKMALLREWLELKLHREETLDMHRALKARHDAAFQRFMALVLPH